MQLFFIRASAFNVYDYNNNNKKMNINQNELKRVMRFSFE